MEFALVENKIYVLQIRPLVKNENSIEDKEINKYIKETNYEINNLFKNENKIYSLMSDWNPAEIIGKLPSVLSSSIYKYIITEKNWYISRKLDGYKEVKSPLLINILGTDYVDVIKSIKSFIPADIENDITNKIVNKAYHYLSNNPSLHDKIEFEIIPTCMDLNWEKWKIYFKDKLTLNELEVYRKSLIENTKRIMRITVRTQDQKSIKELLEIDSSNPKIILREAIFLLEEIQNKLAIEFARSARRAFIVTSWLKSGLERKIISKSAELGFYKSLQTISSDFINDINEKKLTDDDIYFKYGHLRPSSYDIQSKCYLERKINKNNFHKEDEEKYKHDLKSWETEKHLLFSEINKLFEFDSNYDLEKIMKNSVILREKNKFEFTKLTIFDS